MDLILVETNDDSEHSSLTEGHFIFLYIAWRQNTTSIG